MQVWLAEGRPFTIGPFGFSIGHGGKRADDSLPAPGTSGPGATSRQDASQPSPGVPLRAPSSHCSSHSMSALPHVSTLHEGEHPSHEWLFPSSHSSPSSTTPLPHWAGGVPHGGRLTFCAMTGGGGS